MRIKSFPEVVGSILATIGNRTSITNFNTGSIIRTMTEVFSVVVTELYVFAGEMLAQGFLDTATGFWLERKAAEYGLVRKPAVKAEGVVTYARRIARATNVPIPEGSIVTTPKDQSGLEYRYFTTAPALLLSGTISIDVPVQAEFVGSAYNVGSGGISKMTTFIAGVDSVTNGASWQTTVGVDEEPDALFRKRCYLAWDELSQGGTAAAYVSWALSVPGVYSAFVDDNLPRGDGTLDIYIVGEAGSPDPALIAEVQALIDSNRPITADALVKAPDPVEVPITMTVVPRAGFDTTAMDTEIRRRMTVYFADVDDATLAILPLGVGKDVVVSQIVAIVMGVSGVYSAVLSAPSADVVIAPNEYPELGTVTITMGAPSYE